MEELIFFVRGKSSKMSRKINSQKPTFTLSSSLPLEKKGRDKVQRKCILPKMSFEKFTFVNFFVLTNYLVKKLLIVVKRNFFRQSQQHLQLLTKLLFFFQKKSKNFSVGFRA